MPRGTRMPPCSRGNVFPDRRGERASSPSPPVSAGLPSRMRAAEPMAAHPELAHEPLRAILLGDSAGRIAGTYGRASEVFGYSEHELLMLRVDELVETTDELAPLGRRKNGTLFPIKVERDPLTFDTETLVVLTIDPTVHHR